MKYLYLLFIIVTAITSQAMLPQEEQALLALLTPDEFARVTGATPQSAVKGSDNDWGLSQEEMQEAIRAEEQRAYQLKSGITSASESGAAAASQAASAGGQNSDAALAFFLQQEEEMLAKERAGFTFAQQLEKKKQEERDAAMAARLAAMDLEDGVSGAAAYGSAVASQAAAAGDQNSDAALAALLQQQEEEKVAKKRASFRHVQQLEQQQQQEQDAAMAARLAAEDLKGYRFGAAAAAGGFAKPHIIQDIEKRRKFYYEMPALHKAFNAKVQANMPQNGAGEYDIDVHAFNGFIRETFGQYIALDVQTLETKADHPWALVHNSLQQFLTENPAIKGRLNQTETFMNGQGKAYLQGGAIDPEIGYSYPILLSRCWDLILRGNFKGPAQEVYFNGEKYLVSVTAMEKLAYAYHENIAKQGGCASGFAGRLARVYIELMNMLY